MLTGLRNAGLVKPARTQTPRLAPLTDPAARTPTTPIVRSANAKTKHAERLRKPLDRDAPGSRAGAAQITSQPSTLATASRDHHAGAHAHRPPLPIRGNGGDDAERGRKGGARADMGARGILPRGTHRLPYIDRTHGRGEGRWRARRMGTAHGRRPRQRAGTEVGTGKAAAPSKSTPHLAPTYGYGR